MRRTPCRINCTLSQVRMATNAASYNPSEEMSFQILSHLHRNTNDLPLVGEETGPVTGNPPPLSGETKEAITNATQSSSMGQHASGKDAGSKVGTTEAIEGEKKAKSEKERMDAS